MKYVATGILLLVLSVGISLAQANPRAGVVGDGTPGSCTESALDVALAGGGLITFDCGEDTTIILTSTKNITVNTTIDGSGDDEITLEGDSQTRLFSFTANTLTFQNILLFSSNSGTTPGGVVSVGSGSTLNVINSVFAGNIADTVGGAIAVSGSGVLNVSGSTFYGNVASTNGGAIHLSGTSIATIVNTTFTGNASFGLGGAVRIDGGTANVSFTTFFENGAIGGDGFAISQTGGVITVKNSLFSGFGPHCSGTLMNSGGNYVSTEGTCSIATSGNLALEDSGTFIPYYTPGEGSIAIDGAINCSDVAGIPVTVDQLGNVRPGLGSPICDSGAIEVQEAPPATATPTGTATNTPTNTFTSTLQPTATDTPTNTSTNTPEPTITDVPTDEPTSTLEPTATDTPATTQTPVETNTPESPTEIATDLPTATPTEVVMGVELIVNGDFETLDGDGKPDVTPWTIKNASGDKAKCDKDKDGDGIPDKIVANTGNCAFVFKGVAGEAGKIQQNLDFSGVSLTVGDALNLSFYAQSKSTGLVKFKVVVKYSDDTKDKISAESTSAEVYTLYMGSTNLTGTSVTKGKVNVKMLTESGKVNLDTVSLILVPVGSETPAARLGSTIK